MPNLSIKNVPPEVVASLRERAAQFELARRMKLTAYDAVYLQLAMNLHAPLATFNQKLGEAAKAVLSQV